MFARLMLVVAYACLVCSANDDLDVIGVKHEDSTTANSATSTDTTLTVVSTTVDTTTESPTSTSSANLTTADHNVTSALSTEHTSALSTEHTSAPTTAAPKPPPHPPVPAKPATALWIVNETGIACVLLEAGIRLTFNYILDNATEAKNYQLDVPADGNTTVSGSCGSVEQTIYLHFFEDWTLGLTFALNDTRTPATYDLQNVSFTYEIGSKDFPYLNKTGKPVTVPQVVKLFETDNHKKYSCDEGQLIYPDTGKPLNVTNAVVSIETFMLSFEAFRNSTTKDFSSNVNRCSQDTVSQLVPIIVGAALGGLILIVLIAYLIGRKRSRRGYESV